MQDRHWVLDFPAKSCEMPKQWGRVPGPVCLVEEPPTVPANLWMVFDLSVWPEVPVWARWARLPFQALFIWWAWVVMRDPEGRVG